MSSSQNTKPSYVLPLSGLHSYDVVVGIMAGWAYPCMSQLISVCLRLSSSAPLFLLLLTISLRYYTLSLSIPCRYFAPLNCKGKSSAVAVLSGALRQSSMSNQMAWQPLRQFQSKSSHCCHQSIITNASVPSSNSYESEYNFSPEIIVFLCLMQ